MTDQPSYPDALGSFVDQSRRLAAAEREVARLREVEVRALALSGLARYHAQGVDVSPEDRAAIAVLCDFIEGEEPDVPEVRERGGEVLEGPAPDQ